MHAWEYILRIHRNVDLDALIVFYGLAASILCFLILQLIRTRKLGIAMRARQGVSRLAEEMEGLKHQAGETQGRLERKVEEKLEEAHDEVSGRLAQELGQAQGRFEQRLQETDARRRELLAAVDGLRERIDEVQGAMPTLYEQLDQFRTTLSRVFRTEVGSVLSAFDNSVGAVLEHMKADLHMGLTRLEGIESMVQSRHKAEQALIGPAGEDAEAPAPALQARTAQQKAASAPRRAWNEIDFAAELETQGKEETTFTPAPGNNGKGEAEDAD